MKSDSLINPTTKEDIESYISFPMHALLIEGEASSGKGFLAHFVAEKLVGRANRASSILTLQGNKEASIEAIRDLGSFLKLTKPGEQKIRRVVIIEDLDCFGHEAQNALLKILEEPPDDTVILTTTSNSKLLLPTVKSRAVKVRVRPISLNQALDYFKDQSQDSVREAHLLSDGLPALLITLLRDQESIAHPLLGSIEKAKELLRMKTYERLLEVDGLSKLELDVQLGIISALQKLLRASILHSKKSLTIEQKKLRTRQLESLHEAFKHLEAHTQSKAVFCNLFIKL